MSGAERRESARVATTSIFALNGLGIGAWAATIPHLKAVLSLSDGALSLPLLAFAAGAILAMPAAALLAPRLGTGHAVRLAALVFAAALALPRLASGLGVLVPAAACLGATNGALDVLMNAHASDIERRLGRPIMSAFHAAFSAGALAGAGLAAVLLARGIDGLLVTAGIGLALGALCWRRVGPGSRGEASAGLALPHRGALPLGAIALLSMLCEGAVADWSAVYLTSIVRVPEAQAATGFAAFSAMMVIGRLTGDRIVGVIGRRRVGAFGGAIAAAGLALAVAVPRFWPAVLGFALAGAGLANVVPGTFSAAGRRAGAAEIAAVATLGYAGFLLGPPLVGATSTLAGLAVALGLLALCAAGIAALSPQLEKSSPMAR